MLSVYQERDLGRLAEAGEGGVQPPNEGGSNYNSSALWWREGNKHSEEAALGVLNFDLLLGWQRATESSLEMQGRGSQPAITQGTAGALQRAVARMLYRLASQVHFDLLCLQLQGVY